jgi:hypothetical protein
MPDDVPNPPAYIRFDKKQREEFLSQYGITSPSQREMFHQLCNSWRPLIDFDSFTGARTGVVTHPVHETENLIARFKAAHLGLFTYKKNEKGERVPKDIVLCEEESPRYWFHFIQDLIQQACDNPRNPYLTVGILRAREILLPAGEIEDVSLARIAKGSIDALAKSERLLFLTLQGERVLATSQTLALLLTFSSAKLRFVLKNPEITAAASRLLNLGLSDVAKRLEDKESGFWRGLTETLLAHKDDLLADRRLHLEPGFFQAAELFYHYLTNQIEEVKKLKELAAERDADMRQLEQLVLTDKDVLMPPEELESHLKLLFRDKYGDAFESLREEFLTTYTQTTQKTSLPVILTLKAGLVHRNNLYRYFLKRFDSLGPLLLQEYRIKMDKRLRKNRNNTDLDFLNKENLERSLSEWTAKNDPLVGELFERPKLLAEAVIHHGRTNQGLASIEDMKPLLERFFKPGVMTFRSYQEVYGLDVPALYEDSFKRLSVLVQFWRRLTGSFRIQGEEFRALALPKEKRVSDPSRATLSGLQIDETPLEKLSPEELKARKEEWKRRKNSGALSPSPKKGEAPAAPAAPVILKQYSDGERDKAWTSFKDTIVKKD